MFVNFEKLIKQYNLKMIKISMNLTHLSYINNQTG